MTRKRTQGTGSTLRQRHKYDGEEQLWHIFADGSKSEQGVGTGSAVFTGRVLTEQLKLKLKNLSSNNQAEQLAIVKPLKVIETQQVNNNNHRTAVINTYNKISLASIRSAKCHNNL